MRSSRILNPMLDRPGASRRTIPVRIAKQPLIGSLRSAPIARAPARRETRPDHQVERRIVAQRRQHARQQRLVMLQVAVDHRRHRRGGRAHRLHAGGGQPPPPDPLDHPHPRIGARQLQRGLGDAVGAVVVDEDRLPSDPFQRRREPLHQRRHVLALVERRHDHREFERAGRSGDRGMGRHRPGMTGGGESGNRSPEHINQPLSRRQRVGRPVY